MTEKNQETIIEEQRQQISMLKEQLALLQRMVFGQKREKVIHDSSEMLPDFEMPEPPVEEEIVQETEVVKKKTTRKKFSQFAFPDDAPREEIIIDLPEAEKEGLKPMGEDRVEKLAYCKGHYFIKVYVTKKYSDPSRPQDGVSSAEMSKPAIPGSRIDESILSNLLVSKYCDHLPLYRLVQIYSRDNLHFTKQTLSSWVLKSGALLAPLGDLLLNEILATRVIYTDDSPVQLQVKGLGKTQTARMWIYVAGEGGDPPLVYYQFTPDRKKQHPLEKFKNFSGAFHSDALAAYEEIAQRDCITWQPCWAHARRKFFDSITSHPLKKEILTLVDKLFMQERNSWAIEQEDISASDKLEKRLKHREENCAQIVDQIFSSLKASLQTGTHLPKQKLTEAIGYLLKREKHFRSFLTNAALRIDNNVSERNIRPLAIGRKNWLFVGSQDGGRSAATILSLVQTCKNLKINPQQYLEDILRRINNTPEAELSTLLPQNWKK